MVAQSPQPLLTFTTRLRHNLLGYCGKKRYPAAARYIANSPPGRPEKRYLISKIWYLISILQHQIGNKQYELSNHLGNVQATVTDNRTFGIVEGDSVKMYKPVIAAAYDYYPFGMLMPDRYVSDTSAKCVTVTQSKWVTKKVLQCYNVTNWIWPGYIQWGSGKATPVQLPSDPDNAGILIEVNATSGVQFEFEVAADADNEFQLETAELIGSAATVSCFELIGGQQVSLGSFALAQSYQMIKVSIKPTTTKIYTSITGGTTGTAVKIKQLCKWVPVMVQETILVDVCDGDKDRYRFGFNGQEKVNEWSGVGNHLSFEYRGHDSRTGRFLSVDPVAKTFPWNSTYAFAENDVISCIDIEGLEKYRIVGRSFAPRGAFMHSHFESVADNRTKFQIADYREVSARIHTMVSVNMGTLETSYAISTQPTYLKGRVGGKWDAKNYKMRVLATPSSNPKSEEKWVRGGYWAKNGTDVGPGIDIQFFYTFTQGKNSLNINTMVTGNTFPAQETMIFDRKGTGLFLGVSTATGGPLSGVWGSGEDNLLSQTNINVLTNDDGDFLGVNSKDKNGDDVVVSPEQYNKAYTEQKVWDGQVQYKNYEPK